MPDTLMRSGGVAIQPHPVNQFHFHEPPRRERDDELHVWVIIRDKTSRQAKRRYIGFVQP